MSVLIKGMKKPEECYCCPCSTINMDGRWGKCNLLGRDYAGDPHKIYNDCPLVEIPPHGRLIDGDKLENTLSGLGDRAYRRTKGTIMDAQKFLSYAPIVIEAEEQ